MSKQSKHAEENAPLPRVRRQRAGVRPERKTPRPDAAQATRTKTTRARPGAQRTSETPEISRTSEAPVPSESARAVIAEFIATQPYPLDPFQVEAAGHLADGRSVLVAAPTGTGKTIVAEAAIWLAQRAGQRAIYTAPIKALSNQKFRDLRALYGPTQVGLMTGDIVENPAAPIVVMTTEIYRNMLLEGLRAARTSNMREPTPAEEASVLLRAVARRAGATGIGQSTPTEAIPSAADIVELARRARLDEELSSVGCVIFDELHYLNDAERGPVWEEAIIHSPPHVTFVGLSATVSNADELRRWIEEVHGSTALVYHAERAIPLEHFYFLDDTLHLVQNADGRRVERFPKIGGEAKLARMFGRGRRFSYGDSGAGTGPTHEANPKSTAAAPSAAQSFSVATSATDAPAEEADRAPGASKTPDVAGGERASRATRSPQNDLPLEHATPRPAEIITALRNANLLPCL
ncbi:MAG TPA: DEAD/DEAH box helicase, partial [Ktedonobacterales bacterium]|nr:DEAD/DEAH box helicase [Ktedonobacterales bacterium]